jgi:hypothetical protein
MLELYKHNEKIGIRVLPDGLIDSVRTQTTLGKEVTSLFCQNGDSLVLWIMSAIKSDVTTNSLERTHLPTNARFLKRPQGTQRRLLCCGETLGSCDIQSLIGPVAAQCAAMLNALQVPERDDPVINVNEVISNRCIQLVGGTLGSQKPIHPNDHVNMGQSSNDTFPTAMHIAAYKMATEKTIPALKRLCEALDTTSKKWADVVKIGWTHLEDATPLTVGQEWSGYVGALEDAIAEVKHATDGLLKLAMGGTAVGTGLNAPPGFKPSTTTWLSGRPPWRTASMRSCSTALSTRSLSRVEAWRGWADLHPFRSVRHRIRPC